MSRKPSIIIVDDDHDGSALERARELEFLTDFHLKGAATAAAVTLPNQVGAKGFQVLIVGPDEILNSDGKDWENVLFLIDVSWAKFRARFSQLEHMSEESLHVYGIVLCEHVLAHRMADRNVFLNFYSNSAYGAVLSYVQRWKGEGRPGVAAVISGQMEDGRPAMQAYCLEQVWEIVQQTLGQARAETMAKLREAAQKWPMSGPASLEEFLGEAIGDEIDGWSLADTVFPLYAEFEFASHNPRRTQDAAAVLRRWRERLSNLGTPAKPATIVRFELPASPCNLPVLLLTQLARYGTVDFLDAFLYFRVGTVDCTKFLDPLALVGDKPSPSWVQGFGFRQRLSDIVQRNWVSFLRPKAGKTPAALPKGWPAQLVGPPAFDFIRNGEIKDAALTVEGTNGRYTLQVANSAAISNRFLEAAQLVAHFKPTTPYDDRLLRAYELDPGSLVVLEALALRIEQVIKATRDVPTRLEPLADGLHDAVANLKVAIEHLASLEVRLDEATRDSNLPTRQQSALARRLRTDWRGKDFNAAAKIVRWRTLLGTMESALAVLRDLLPKKESFREQCERLMGTSAATEHKILFDSVFQSLCEQAQGRALAQLRRRFRRQEAVITKFSVDYWPTERYGRQFWHAAVITVLPELRPLLQRLSDTQLQIRVVQALVAEFIHFAGRECSLNSSELMEEIGGTSDDTTVDHAQRALRALSPGAPPSRRLIEAVGYLCERFIDEPESFFERFFSHLTPSGKIRLSREKTAELWGLLSRGPCAADLSESAFLDRIDYE